MKYWIRVLCSFDDEFYSDKISICKFISTSIFAAVIISIAAFIAVAVLFYFALYIYGLISIITDTSGLISLDLTLGSVVVFILSTPPLIAGAYVIFGRNYLTGKFPWYGKLVSSSTPGIISQCIESISNKTCFYINLSDYNQERKDD